MTLSLEFAFEGFRIIRQRPKLILFWGALSLIGYGGFSLLMIAMAGPAMTSLAKMSMSSPDTQVVMQAMTQIVPALMAGLPIYLLTSAVLSAAVCRVASGDEDDRFGYLAFGRREALLFALELVMLAIRALVMLGCLVLAAAISQALPSAASEAVAELLMFAAMGLVLWLSLRLSFNMAQTFEDGRLNVFGSYAMTRDLFWPLFAGYATAFGLTIVVVFLCNRIIDGVLMLAFGLATGKVVPVGDMSSLSAFLTPPHIVDLILTNGVMSPLTASILIAAPLSAYRTVRGQRRPAAT